MTCQLVIFRAFFFVPATLNLKKCPVNQLIKKFWPNLSSVLIRRLHVTAAITVIIVKDLPQVVLEGI